jgi:hypothetical protein
VLAALLYYEENQAVIDRQEEDYQAGLDQAHQRNG